MSLCVTIAGKVAVHAVTAFSLSWTHSVQKTEWREDWSVTPAGLEIREAAVKGSGAGMEPGDNAVFRNGWWVWQPQVLPVPELRLAASGATEGGWTLCDDGGCIELGAKAGAPVVLSRCP